MNISLKKLLICFFVFLVVSSASYAEIVSDPERHFISKINIENMRTIIRIDADLNGNGKDDKLYSLRRWQNSDVGFIWVPYIAKDEGYIVDWKNMVSLRDNAIHYGYVESLGRKALLTYVPSGRIDGYIVAVYAEGEKIKTRKIKKINLEFKEEDKKLYTKYFSQERWDKVYSHYVKSADSLTFDSEDGPQSGFIRISPSGETQIKNQPANYLYPRIIETSGSCEKYGDSISSNSNVFHGDPGCAQYEEKTRSVDLNGDGECEYFVTYAWGRRCESVTKIMGNNGKLIGDIFGDPKDFKFGEKLNGYYRIVHQTWGGHRTNIIYTTKVYSFDGKKYKCEYCSDNSHGGFLDLAKRAYDKKNYPLAERYYLNAYRMNGEARLSDANNIAITLIKQNKYIDAINILEKHLAKTDESLTLSESTPCYMGSCRISVSKLTRIKSSAYFNRGLAYEKQGDQINALKNYKIADNLHLLKPVKKTRLAKKIKPEKKVIIVNKITPKINNKHLFETTVIRPNWFDLIESPVVNTLGEIDKHRERYYNMDHDNEDRLYHHRIFYKGCYNAIINNYKNEDVVIRCLSLMRYAITRTQKNKISRFLVENYIDYKSSKKICGRCSPGDTIALITHRFVKNQFYGSNSEYNSREDGNEYLIALLEKLLDRRRPDIRLFIQTEIYQTLGSMYLLSSVNEERKDRLRKAYIRLDGIREYNKAVDKRFSKFEATYKHVMAR